MTKVIMVQGTMSNSGKSFIVAGLCRLLKRRGYKVAPFKSQNMALNSFITSEGLEMGRAQVMQAEAAGIKPGVDMNPILLKPTSNSVSQVIRKGRVLSDMSAAQYYSEKTKFIPIVLDAYKNLCEKYDIIVIEGAGSPAEINLNKNDIVNMGLAKLVNAPVLLVADIDRGGVFASIYGTVALLDEESKRRIKGIIINKFRGDKNLLLPGFGMLQNHFNTVGVKIPVIGVVPMANIDIDDEDSLSNGLNTDSINFSNDKINIAVIRLPHISNFTDFNPLIRQKGVSLKYISDNSEITGADLIIIPGTKNTISDLRWLKRRGFIREALAGKNVCGICGGFQMLGYDLYDPFASEESGRESGLSLLHFETVFSNKKITRQVKANILNLPDFIKPLKNTEISGYEIHMGESKNSRELSFSIVSGREDGFVNRNIFGTYIHGIFDNNHFSEALLQGLAKQNNKNIMFDKTDIYVYKNKEYDKMADLLEESLDLDALFDILK